MKRAAMRPAYGYRHVLAVSVAAAVLRLEALELVGPGDDVFAGVDGSAPNVIDRT